MFFVLSPRTLSTLIFLEIEGRSLLFLVMIVWFGREITSVVFRWVNSFPSVYSAAPLEYRRSVLPPNLRQMQRWDGWFLLSHSLAGDLRRCLH